MTLRFTNVDRYLTLLEDRIQFLGFLEVSATNFAL